mmetsp:Transcript_17174/g.33672  ORF Transcript_17174/g.33672 Transcript_17174/m.33672 type:complete len:202 (-) Transcript_17174:610-1215(-)
MPHIKSAKTFEIRIVTRGSKTINSNLGLDNLAGINRKCCNIVGTSKACNNASATMAVAMDNNRLACGALAVNAKTNSALATRAQTSPHVAFLNNLLQAGQHFGGAVNKVLDDRLVRAAVPDSLFRGTTNLKPFSISGNGVGTALEIGHCTTNLVHRNMDGLALDGFDILVRHKVVRTHAGAVDHNVYLSTLCTSPSIAELF